MNLPIIMLGKHQVRTPLTLTFVWDLESSKKLGREGENFQFESSCYYWIIGNVIMEGTKLYWQNMRDNWLPYESCFI